MISDELIDILRCPESRSPLRLADDALLSRLNRAIAEGRLQDRLGERVTEPIEGALIREEGDIAYGITDGIPVLLIEHGMPLDQLSDSADAQ